MPRLVEKAHQHLLKYNHQDQLPENIQNQHIMPSLEYGRQIGNSYTASLYIGLASLFDHADVDLSDKRIGFYSYGSGCVAEYFSGVVQPGYQAALHTDYHKQLLSSRTFITYEDYEAFYTFFYPEDGNHFEIPVYHTGFYRLARIQNHKRIYEPVALTAINAESVWNECVNSL